MVLQILLGVDHFTVVENLQNADDPLMKIMIEKMR